MLIGVRMNKIIHKDYDMRRKELWYQYTAEVASFERFGQKNIITFDEWLDIKGYNKNETKAGI